MRSALIVCIAIFAIVIVAIPTNSEANDPALCLKTCIEKHGADKKQACAVDCGYAKGLTGGQRKQVDCGTQYKHCLGSCKKGDKNCRKQCRQQRTTCH